ncbi:MAG TPA: M20/M25/M40 family metallo-hydrolase [Gemmatimonadales bacterium]|nr:M20/M25/M40 family metallo-hydrolase [Gemmatimonadales bacterium]
MSSCRALSLSLVLVAGACGAPSAQAPVPLADPVPTVNAAALDAHLRYLSDDLLEGRAPGTRGGELAARYIAAQFQALGLEGAGADGSYFQPVALVGTTPEATLAWGAQGAARTLRFTEEFVAWAERPEAEIVADGEVVFVGYGIAAPEWQWDDYKDADLRGKILLVLVNDPGLRDSTIFLGRTLTYYGRWTYKLEEAARRGAAGVFLVHTDESATYPWSVVRGSWTVEQFQLDRPAGPALSFAGWVTSDAASAALRTGGLDLDSLSRAAVARAFRPVTTGLRAAVTVSSRVRRVRSANVVGRLRGSDSVLAREAVLFTAHYDHKGVGIPVAGDSIYNGAEDNASGVAAMLGAADALVRSRPRPRRSVLFIATTAEESGLLGSAAYAADPLVPLDRTAAVINLDHTNVRGLTRDISALGADRSTLGAVLAAAARAESLTVVETTDERGSFFRSDHFPLARAGVPAVSVQRGEDYVGRSREWAVEQEALWNTRRYHQPSDAYSHDFDYAGMVQQVRVVVRIAQEVANAAALPQWKPTSEFQRARPGR